VRRLNRKLPGLKRIDFCIPKRARLERLVEERGPSGGEVTPEEQKLSKHVAIFESRRSGMWDLAHKIKQEEQNLKAMS
jgi:hypothetical protein